MNSRKRQNLERVLTAARQLGELAQEVVFAGGAATGLLVTDPGVPDIRPTIDIDVIVEVITLAEYYRLQDRIRKKGFQEYTEGELICRWRYREILLDVMPTDKRILGFANRWYSDAFRTAEEVVIEGVSLRLIKAPYLLGTKLEAFYGRGRGDFMASHDLEDFITLLDGRLEIIEEVRGSNDEIKSYLAGQIRQLLTKGEFLDALPGYLPPDQASQGRLPILLEQMRLIAEMG